MKDSITLYSSPTCPKCRMLKIELDKHNIEYNETHETDFIAEKGFTSLPVLEVNGDFLTMPNAVKWLKGN
jgi:glutaredoxin